jgi:hypothetical protein
MPKYVTKYLIRATENNGNVRRSVFYANKKRIAKAELKKLLSKPKTRKLPNGKRIYLTSYREAKSGAGFKNPRIVKYRGIK